MSTEHGPCTACGVKTIQRCEHAGFAQGFLCYACRYAVHLGVLLSGGHVDPRYLQDDQLLMDYAAAGGDANMTSTETLPNR